MARSYTLTLVAAALATAGILPRQASAQLEWTGFYTLSDTARYRGAAATGGGFTYTAGFATNVNGDRDILVTLWDADGGVVWNYTWGGLAGGDDQAFDVAATDVGNVVVVGKTYVGKPNDYAAVMLYVQSDGTLWCSQQVNEAPGYPDAFCHVQIRPNDDIFAAGYSQETADPATSRILLASWDDNCGEYFSNFYTQGFRADGFDMDGSGNSYIAATQNLGGDENIVISKFDLSGGLTWSQTYDGLGFEDGVNDLVTDGFSSLYATGFVSTGSAPGSRDLLALKYGLSGSFAWDYTFDQGGDDEGTGVIDAFGFPVVVGNTEGTGSTGRDGFVAKLDNLGVPFWTLQYAGPDGDNVRKVVGPNSNGDVTMVGHLSNSPPGFGIWVVNASGATIWSDVYHGTGDDADARDAVILNFDGCIAVAGHAHSDAIPTSSDAIVRKYCVTVGMVEDVQGLGATAWPNPFTDVLWLDLPLPHGTIVDVEVVDACGRIQHRGAFTARSSMDLRSLADGAYVVRWRTAGGRQAQLRVMKAG